MVNTWSQHSRRSLPGVYPDWLRIGELVAEHLIARGFRRLSLLCSDQHRAALDAAVGIQQHCDEAGLGVPVAKPKLRVDSTSDWLEIERCLTAWLDELTPPAGVCLQEAAFARLLINLCGARGGSVPQDVAIVSFNENRMIAELPPQITCIDSNHERVGYEAADLLDRLMGGEPAPEQPMFIPFIGNDKFTRRRDGFP